jgi:PAS domain S-box-containing protein
MTTENFSAQSRPRQAQLNKLSTFFTGPSTAIKNDQQKAQARMVSALLLPSGLITLMGWVMNFTSYVSYDHLSLGWVSLVITVGYLLSRTRFYIAGGLLLLVYGSIYALVVSLTWSDAPHLTMHPLYWLVATVMIGSLWLPIKAVIVLGLFEIILVSTTAVFSEKLDFAALQEFLPYFLLVILLVLVSTVVRDRNQNKISDQAGKLADSEAFLNNIIHSMHDLLIVTDTAGAIKTTNHSALQTLGYEVDELLGKKSGSILQPANDISSNSNTAQLIETEPWHRIEKVAVTKMGQRIPVLVSTSDMKNIAGQPLGSVLVAKDMTELKQVENQLRQSQKLQAIGNLAGGIAHEFNNLLGTMMGYIEMILSQQFDTEKIKDYLGTVYREGEKAAELISQILTFSRAEEYKKSATNISKLILETLQLIRTTKPDSITIDQDVEIDVPPVLANANHIQQMIMNLYLNAVDAIGIGTGKIGVSLKTVTELPETLSTTESVGRNYINIRITDSGSGVKPEIIDSIFEPFFTTKGTGEGTGLGLAVVHGIVKEHNGEIQVESRPGKGSTFSVFLPVLDDE